MRLVMYTVGHWMVQRFALCVCAAPTGIQVPRKSVFSTTAHIANPHQKTLQAHFKDAVMWKHLKHPNIVPLFGATITPFRLISRWMSGEDLSSYVRENPDADRLGLVGVPSVMAIQRSLWSTAV